MEPAEYINDAVLGSYVARVDVKTAAGESLTVVSVHASPNPLTALHADLVPAADLMRRAERHAWYADVIGHELIRLHREASSVHVLAAGDFNEAYGWDKRYATDSCAEFFARLADGGLIDATQAAWSAEVPTQTAHPYQVDRIFGSRGLEVRLPNDPTMCLSSDDGLSDHLPITFTVALPSRL